MNNIVASRTGEIRPEFVPAAERAFAFLVREILKARGSIRLLLRRIKWLLVHGTMHPARDSRWHWQDRNERLHRNWLKWAAEHRPDLIHDYLREP